MVLDFIVGVFVDIFNMMLFKVFRVLFILVLVFGDWFKFMMFGRGLVMFKGCEVVFRECEFVFNDYGVVFE